MAWRSQPWHLARIRGLGVKDLVILVADKDLEHAMKGLLARPAALGIRAVETDIFVEPQHDPGELQNSLNERLAHSAWGERAKTIVLAPELGVWIWNDSPHVDEAAGWKNRNPGLRPWLIDNGWLQEGEIKPARPKEAFDQALRAARKPRSASLYEQIAQKVSLRRCKDEAFLELKGILSLWFSATPAESER